MNYILKNIAIQNNKAIYKGNLVIFLHGWGGNKYSFYSCFNFLASYGYPVLSVDLSGFGDNKPLDRIYTIFDYANDLEYFLNKLGIKEFNIVCHSFGNRIASLLYQKFKINKLIITGGAGLKDNSLITKIKILKYKFFKFLVKLKIKNKDFLNKFGSSDYKTLSPNMKKTFINIVNQDLKKYFKKIKCKTLLYWGKKDTQTPVSMAKKLNKYIKNSKLIIDKNGTHFCYIENDFTFCNYVLEFLKGDM